MILESRFRAPWWLSSPHGQTLWGPLCRRLPEPVRETRCFELPDGDFLETLWAPASRARGLVVILHGLSGSADSPYARGLQQALQARGLASVVMQFRGCGRSPNRLARTYHAGDTGDLDCFVKALRADYPEWPLALVGYSLGGNVALKWLGERAGTSPVAAAVAISVPMRLNACALRLNRGFSRIYRRHILRELKGQLQRKRAQLVTDGRSQEVAALDKLGPLDGIKTFRQFDDRVIAPLHGFRDADDYYQRASSRAYLGRIETPTRILQARDDPFMSEAVLPQAAELSAEVRLELANRGGHVGFVTGTSPRAPRYWLEERIPELVAPYLE